MSGDAYYPNVGLLLHCDGVMSGTTFTDNSPSPKTITVTGNAKIDTTQSKFGGSAALFDGVGDYLTAPAHADWDMGSGDFTVECWYKMAVLPDVNGYALVSCGVSTSNRPWGIHINGSNGVDFWVRSSTTYYSASSTNGVGIDTNWHHLAGVREGSTLRVFVDGVQQATGTFSGTPQSGQHLIIGRFEWNSSSDFEGYIDDIRVTKGVARYTADFTPPTAAFPNHAGQVGGIVKDENGDEIAGAIVRSYLRSTGAALAATTSGSGASEITGDSYWQNTVLLLHGEGTDESTTVTDSSLAARTVSVFGNAHIEVDQYKFGSASIAFDGNGDYLSVASHDAFNFLLADYTIELFIRFNVVNATQIILSRYTAWSSAVAFYLELQSTGYIRYRAGNNIPIVLVSTTSIQANTWYHVAITCTGGTTRLFINGVQEASTATTASISSTGALGIGYELSGGLYYLNAYLDELRITKGVSRYTENFTPPAAAFLGATVPASPIGEYLLSFATLDEVQVVALDPSGGETFNDLLLRVTPA